GFENYYINGRYIKSHIITKAIEEAYKGFIMPHNYPFTAIHFEINPAILDVNVHPTKMELRFSKNEFVYQFVLDSLISALKRKELIPEVRLEERGTPPATLQSPVTTQQQPAVPQPVTPQPTEKRERLPEPFEINRMKQADKVSESSAAEQYGVSAKNEETKQLNLFEDKLLDKQHKADYRLIGQLFETYWLIEFEDKFYMMDQHAAHEKILYENLMKSFREKKYDTQMILPPVVLSLNMREEQVLKEHFDIFAGLGYEIEEFGGREYKVTGLPSGLPTAVDCRRLLIDIIDSLAEENTMHDPCLITEKVASMSCKAAVKGNNKLSYKEAEELMQELMQAENPYNCPHGRPTLIMMTKYEIEKKFKRIV
ncbi:MAG: DNA mismatch repair protein MutL, partial [Lachnospira sp.]|nr:DNA mismatch repair protein MutL [Lachnospira sp.]